MAIFLGSSNFSGSNGSHFVANVYLDSYTQDKTNNTTSYKLHLYAGSNRRKSVYCPRLCRYCP